MTDTTQPPAETLAEAREAVAQLTGIIEGTNSWRFLMRGDWDDRYEINGYAVRKAHPRLPWVKAFAVIFTARAALPRRAGGDDAPLAGIQYDKDGQPSLDYPIGRAGGDAIPAGEVRKVAFYYEPGHDIRPGESLPDRDRRIYEQGRHDALRDHLNSRAAAIANGVTIPEYQA